MLKYLMGTKVITFDLDGVYFPNGKANFISALGKIGVSEDEAKRVFLKSPQMNEQYKVGKIIDEQFWTWAVSEWKLAKPWQEIVKLMIDSYDIDERVVSVIQSLRAKGYKTAICSSNFPARIKGLQERFGFLNNFDVIVLSYEIGVDKPDAQIYQKLVDLSEVDAKSVVYADDEIERIEAAKNIGITAFLYEGFDQYLSQLKSVGIEI